MLNFVLILFCPGGHAATSQVAEAQLIDSSMTPLGSPPSTCMTKVRAIPCLCHCSCKFKRQGRSTDNFFGNASRLGLSQKCLWLGLGGVIAAYVKENSIVRPYRYTCAALWFCAIAVTEVDWISCTATGRQEKACANDSMLSKI